MTEISDIQAEIGVLWKEIENLEADIVKIAEDLATKEDAHKTEREIAFANAKAEKDPAEAKKQMDTAVKEAFSRGKNIENLRQLINKKRAEIAEKKARIRVLEQKQKKLRNKLR